jgi:hypothetical protein
MITCNIWTLILVTILLYGIIILYQPQPQSEGFNNSIVFQRNRITSLPTMDTISYRCDWSIHELDVLRPNQYSPNIKYVFVKADPFYIERFVFHYMPQITTDFILVTGCSDRTLPKQMDKRSEPFAGTKTEEALNILLTSHRIIRWYAENLDTYVPKITPIPLGLIDERDFIFSDIAQKPVDFNTCT